VDQFSLSPDGRTIAFTTPTDSSYCEIYTMPLSGGAPLLLTADGHSCIEFMWTPDSQSIVFLSQRTTLPSLWMTPANGGPAQHEATYPALGSFSMDGRRLVYSETTSGEPAAIWRADLAAAEGAILDNRKLIQTQFWESAAQPSPDGSRIVWMSFRTGFGEIWMNGATGGSPLQLTHLSTLSGTPRWSPDGKWIVFDSVIGGSRQVLVVDAEGRNQHAITDGPYDNGVPSWSRDGKSIYFASMRTGSWQVWKHSLDSGAELQLTEYGGFDPFESQDGRTIYFSRYDQAGIWSIPVGGGTESLVVANKPQYGYWGCWAVTGTGLYLFNLDAEPRPRIEFYDFATHRTSPVLTLEKKLPRWHANLSATADGRRVYYAQFDQQSVIKMMEIAH
jgi:Tol biopolymer transport system component